MVNLIQNVVIPNSNHAVDIFVPDQISKSLNGHPVIFFIHGGAWVMGSKSLDKEPCQSLASNGYICVSADYSLSSASTDQIAVVVNVFLVFMLCLAVVSKSIGQIMFILIISIIVVSFFSILWTCSAQPIVQHPAHILDIAHAFKWTSEHISEYGGNSNQIFVSGHSAGAHLASLLCTNFNYLELINGDPTKIKGCIAISGVYSDKRLQETQLGSQLLKTVFGVRSQYYDAFPIYNVTTKTPPFLLLNAGKDYTLKRHSFDFHYALKQAGVYVETAYFFHQNHMNITKYWRTENDEIMSRVDNFMADVIQYEQSKMETIIK